VGTEALEKRRALFTVHFLLQVFYDLRFEVRFLFLKALS